MTAQSREGMAAQDGEGTAAQGGEGMAALGGRAQLPWVQAHGGLGMPPSVGSRWLVLTNGKHRTLRMRLPVQTSIQTPNSISKQL